MADQIKKTSTSSARKRSTAKKETTIAATSTVAAPSAAGISEEQFEKLMKRLDEFEKTKECPPSDGVIKETFFKEVLQMLCAKNVTPLPNNPVTDLTEQVRADKGLSSRGTLAPGKSILITDLEKLRQKDELGELKEKIERLCRDSLKIEKTVVEIKKTLEELEKKHDPNC